MEHVAIIQELIDENRAALPTGVATELMKHCQILYKMPPLLYRVVWTMVDVHTQVHEPEDESPSAEASMSHRTQTVILEVDLQDSVLSVAGLATLLMRGILHKALIKQSMPFVINNGSCMTILHSVEAYDPCKRKRGA